jgi:signal transduction histidine kinase
LEAAAQLAGLVLLGSITFTSSGKSSSPALLYSLVPVLLWSALRIGWMGVSTSMVVVAFLSIWGAVHGRGPFAVEGPLGNPLWLQLQLFLVFAAAPFMVLAAAIEERKLAEQALAGFSRKLIDAQEQERTRIARELHDDVSQRLAMLTIDLGQVPEDYPDLSSEVRRRMSDLKKEASEIASDIQSLSHELHSSKLEYLGITAAIRSFCKEFGEQQRVEIDLQIHDVPNALSPDVSLCLFRVLQEALHNSAKHSGVRQYEVRLWGTSDEIHLTVSDSGAGFDSEVVKAGRGLGLISMGERLKLVNGTFSIESRPHRGTTIHACLPFRSRSDPMPAAG